MTRVLSQLLNVKEPAFSMGLVELERKSGHPSIDVNLTAEIQATVYSKTKEMGLDPNDTTAKELYHGLQSMIQLHDQFLSKKIGITEDDNIDDQISKVIKSIDSLPISKNSWVIKHSVAKKILKASPPNKVKSLLGYKSLDSMLKRENIDNLLIYARLAESPTWLKKMVRAYKKLTPSDFENREISITVMKQYKLQDCSYKYMSENKHNIINFKEFGIISILPLPVKFMPGLTLTIMPMILHYINEIRSYDAYFKMQQVKPNFGEKIVDIILNDPSDLVKIANQDIHWRLVQRHFGSQPSEDHPEMFEPHIQPEDLHWRKAESVIYWLEPALKFWENLDFVGALYPDAVVPLSLMDNAVSYCNHLEFGKHSNGFFRASLRNEIFIRYLGHQSFENTVLQQINKHVINPELVGI